MENGYIIQIGIENTPKVIVAYPDKDGKPKGDGIEQVSRVGTHQLVNRARVWARRVMGKNGEKKLTDTGEEILHNTPGYRGKLEFLPWGESGGYAIDIRYIPQSDSLDFEYQDLIQRIKIDPNTGFTFLELKTGQNQFDYKKDALLIEFWKVYPRNRDSISKNPDPQVKGFSYFEITDKHVDTTVIKRIEKGSEATKIVMEISDKPANLKALLAVIGKDNIAGVTELSLPLEMYKGLLQYADLNPVDFFGYIDAYKRGVQDDFEKAKSFKALDISKNGHIALIIDGKVNILTSEAEGKGDGMIEWMVNNYYEEEVYKATQILKSLVTKLK